MSQLSLNIIPRLPYSPDNFVLHEGVREAYAAVKNTINYNGYSVLWIHAPKRFGKTHFSVRIINEALSMQKYPKLIEGKNFAEFLKNGFLKNELIEDQLFIVDDAEEFFNNIHPGDSGEFVNFVEHLRQHAGHLIFLSNTELGSFPCDGHVTSRLKAGLFATFSSPAEKDMHALVNHLARQRGLSLNEKRIDYVSKRIRRDIPYLENYLDRVSHLSSVLSKSVTRPILANAL